MLKLPRFLRWTAVLLVVAMAFAAGLRWGVKPGRSAMPPDVAGFLWPLLPPMEPFLLRDTRGEGFGEARLHGKWTLLTFGYTRCGDLCAETLKFLHEARHGLAEVPTWRTRGQVAFVSVDEARDEPAALRRYVDRFDPQFLAATGSPEQIHLLTRQVGVHVMKVSGEAPADYWFELSPVIFLISPNLEVVGEFLPPLTTTGFIRDVTRIIEFIER